MKLWILFTAGIVAAIFFFVPSIKGLGESDKIIFFHISTAWTSVVAFFTGALFAGKFLKSDEHCFDKLSFRAIRLGFIFVLLATTSGTIFSKLTGAHSGTVIRDKPLFLF